MHKSIRVTYLIASLGLCALPLLAHAKPILLSNFTKESVAVTINHQCQTGVLAKQAEVTYTEATLKQICKNTTRNCQAEVFKDTCAGEKIAEFNFNVQRGLKGSYRTFGSYAITEDYTDNSVLITEAE